MQSVAITLTGSRQQLSASFSDLAAKWIYIDNPAGNNTLYLGGDGGQLFPLGADKQIMLPSESTVNVWLKGTISEVVNVLIGY